MSTDRHSVTADLSPGRYVTLQQAARDLAVHPATIRRMIDRGELRARRIGALVRVDADDLARAGTPITPAIADGDRA